MLLYTLSFNLLIILLWISIKILRFTTYIGSGKIHKELLLVLKMSSLRYMCSKWLNCHFECLASLENSPWLLWCSFSKLNLLYYLQKCLFSALPSFVQVISLDEILCALPCCDILASVPIFPGLCRPKILAVYFYLYIFELSLHFLPSRGKWSLK